MLLVDSTKIVPAANAEDKTRLNAVFKLFICGSKTGRQTTFSYSKHPHR